MQPVDFFRARIDAMINLNDPLAALANRLPWGQIEEAIAHKFERQHRTGEVLEAQDLFGTTQTLLRAGRSNAGRPKLPIRLMASLLYLKHSANLSDEALVIHWSQNILWQYFSGMDYFEHRLPCDATQMGRFRRDLGEDGMELLLKATIDTALAIRAVVPKDLERVIVDTTVQEKAIAHPTDSRLLEIARHKVVAAAKRCGMSLKQTFAKEGKALRWKASGYAHAKQFRRLRQVLKRQRTILGIVMREVQRKLQSTDVIANAPKTASDLSMWLKRAERIRSQERTDKNKLYALHAPEVECIGKGKARKPYEFGVKAAVVVTHQHGLLIGARTFAGNPYDGHILSAALEQATNLTQDIGSKLQHIVVDLGFRGVEADNVDKEIIHRGKFKRLNATQKGWLKRRSAVEPAIGHLKSDHRMNRCWLKGALGDALHAISCAAGYNIKWLLRAIARLGIKSLFLRLFLLASAAAKFRQYIFARKYSNEYQASCAQFGVACRSGEFCRGD